ncbi:hypothetical protein FWK35_00017830 [Aphis craccivora]|uniref:Uncharacterized protein n=1 Tax=Aphis craccivora TaxID=307492 RepID=A0A6G0Y986_APHCR|nr:hypothetical protein FWK35_00017830 [Aphis craccivora]
MNIYNVKELFKRETFLRLRELLATGFVDHRLSSGPVMLSVLHRRPVTFAVTVGVVRLFYWYHVVVLKVLLTTVRLSYADGLLIIIHWRRAFPVLFCVRVRFSDITRRTSITRARIFVCV